MPVLLLLAACSDRGGRSDGPPGAGPEERAGPPGGGRSEIELPVRLPRRWEPSVPSGPAFEISVDRRGAVLGPIEEAKRYRRKLEGAPQGIRSAMAPPTIVLLVDRSLLMRTLIEEVWKEVVASDGAVRFRCRDGEFDTFPTTAWDEGAREGEGLLRYRVEVEPTVVRYSVERSPPGARRPVPERGSWPVLNQEEGIGKLKEWMRSRSGAVEYTVDCFLPHDVTVEKTLEAVDSILSELDGALGVGFKVAASGNVHAQVFVGKVTHGEGPK